MTSLGYDEVPYPGISHGLTHPDRLAVVATLLGVEPAPPGRCRLLELGCASGGNLLPMAYSSPGSCFVGVDSAPGQIAEARARAERLGLGNVTLECMDIREIDRSLGTFDYIVAHGVYSWVPEDVRDRLIVVCRDQLAPQGVAYVSYNTYPGWHLMAVARDAMRYRSRKAGSSAERAKLARAMLDFLTKAIPEDLPHGSLLQAYGSFLTHERDSVGEKADAYLLHDELEELNAPVYFHQFIAHARRRGLAYLCEADMQTVFAEAFPPDVARELEAMSDDLVEMEQYMDFLRNRMFRRTLLCREGVPVERSIATERLEGLWIASRVRPSAPAPNLRDRVVESFVGDDGGTISMDHPVSKAAMIELALAWPQALPFDALLRQARNRLDLPSSVDASDEETWQRDRGALGANLLQAFIHGGGLVQLHAYQPAIEANAGTRPTASPVARWEAKARSRVTNVWHQRVHLNEFQRLLIGLLDGHRTREEVYDVFISLAREGRVNLRRDGEVVEGDDIGSVLVRQVDAGIRQLGKAALLVPAR